MRTSRKNVFWNTLKYDLYRGTHRIIRYIPFLITTVTIYLFIFCREKTLMIPDVPITLTDYMFGIYRGVMPFRDDNNQFTLPVIWLIIHFYQLFLLGMYPLQDLSDFGHIMILQSQSKLKWYISKCAWLVFTVILLFGCIVTPVFLFGTLQGSVSFQFTSDIAFDSTLSTHIIIPSTPSLMFTIWFLPLITLLSLAALQFCLSFLTTQLISYIIVVCILLISCYCNSLLLIGNGALLIRNTEFMNNGINTNQIIIVLLFVIFLSFFSGYWIFCKKDIL